MCLSLLQSHSSLCVSRWRRSDDPLEEVCELCLSSSCLYLIGGMQYNVFVTLYLKYEAPELTLISTIHDLSESGLPSKQRLISIFDVLICSTSTDKVPLALDLLSA